MGYLEQNDSVTSLGFIFTCKTISILGSCYYFYWLSYLFHLISANIASLSCETRSLGIPSDLPGCRASSRISATATTRACLGSFLELENTLNSSYISLLRWMLPLNSAVCHFPVVVTHLSHPTCCCSLQLHSQGLLSDCSRLLVWSQYLIFCMISVCLQLLYVFLQFFIGFEISLRSYLWQKGHGCTNCASQISRNR